MTAGSYVEKPLLERGPIRVAHHAYAAAYTGEVSVPLGNVLLAAPSTGGANVCWNGLEVQPHDLVMTQGYVAIYTAAAARFFTLTLNLAELRHYHPQPLGMLDRLEQASGRPTLWRGTATVRRLHSFLRDLLSSERCCRPDPVARALEGRLLPLVEAAVGEKIGALTPSHSLNRRIRAVLLCQEYMLSRRGEAVTLADLSETSGLRPRSLINAFQAVTSLSPMAFLRSLRLSRVHEALLEEGSQARVIDVATEWGFWHMGHFTAAYRAMFDETPSQTLRRASP
ncbi:MAG TPA: helix-turn-helix domain-containing protein [Candidatus Cybelea sp.]